MLRVQGLANSSLLSAISTIFPGTSLLSVADVFDYSQVMCNEQICQTQGFLQFIKQLITCAWMETSRAEMGSSQMMNSGSTASALATPMLALPR